MNQETFQRHAQGLLDRLREELVQRGCDARRLDTSAQITAAVRERADFANPDPAKRTGGTNGYDVILSQFSSDLYNLMMNYAIRNLPTTFDQLAMLMRNAPEPESPKA